VITGTAPSNTTTNTTQTSTSMNLAGGKLGKDEFLKLLVAQLQNQDPMNPMAGDQMAAQLAQFSSLEQLQQINATLANQSSASGSVLGAIQASSAVNTIGKTVIAIGDQVQIGGDSGAKSVTATIATPGKGTLHIYNAAGVEVGTRALGEVKNGKQTFALGDAAEGLADGAYTYSIDVEDVNGNAVEVQTYTTGRVEGISSSSNGIMLQIGGMFVPYGNVIEVR
jgi:flagellar basal-body rod modification protein FlgD